MSVVLRIVTVSFSLDLDILWTKVVLPLFRPKYRIVEGWLFIPLERTTTIHRLLAGVFFFFFLSSSMAHYNNGLKQRTGRNIPDDIIFPNHASIYICTTTEFLFSLINWITVFTDYLNYWFYRITVWLNNWGGCNFPVRLGTYNSSSLRQRVDLVAPCICNLLIIH